MSIWSDRQLDTLRDGVIKHGTNAWAIILVDGCFQEILSGLTEAGLSEKWTQLCVENPALKRIGEKEEIPGKEEEEDDDDSSSEDTWVCCDKCEAWHVLPEGVPAPKGEEQWFCRLLGPGYDCGVKPGGNPGANAKAPKHELNIREKDEVSPQPSKRVKKQTAVGPVRGMAPARAKYGEVSSCACSHIAVGLGLSRWWGWGWRGQTRV